MQSRDHPPTADCCVLIAVKARHESKGRLARALPAPARLELVRTMLQQVIVAARTAECVERIVVVSPERDVVPDDLPVLADSGQGLNGAISGARLALRAFGARRLIILPADLPTVRAADIDALAAAGRSGDVAIATDRCGAGTNGLYLDDLPDFNLCFGDDSRARHEAEARRLGRCAAIVQRPGLAFDVDHPSDLWEYGQLCKQDRQRA